MRCTNRKKELGTLLLAVALLSARADAEEESIGLFTGLSQNVAQSFSGYRLGLQVSAVAATAELSVSGADAKAHNSFASGSSDGWASPAVYAAFVLPPILGGGMYLVGRLRDDSDLVRASFAGLQATLLTLGYVTILKFVTGRPPPDSSLGTSIEDQSRTFQPGFGRGGILYGWPSGHTAVTASLASSIAAYYDSRALWGVAGCVTAYMAIGMTASAGASNHWFSDTVAGALIGYSIGSSVGEGFRKRTDLESTAKPKTAFSPLFIEQGAGVQFLVAF